ncbi:MAG TPA: ubiquinone/menaquinone biosynthesis methyltransferase [Thermoanaerobaculia bacterium]|jgi:demethylmenaquinone methyltransferase/2-methoxy-6-polyprenyl-1,4-benzoquinol methylase|nr:ubiquinone/menaquinone biosynthesis methyltransferase [Thermoanaerobaculia bacterium]
MAAPLPSAPSLDKSGRAVRDMFAGVAPRYDLLNHLLSGALDLVWRWKSARALSDVSGAPVLDLCCGTGDQALAVAKRGAQVTAGDFCVPMLALAQKKKAPRGAIPPAWLAADALALPFPTAHFAAATVSFGLRNVSDLDQALRELARVVRPGGRLAVLEFALPENRLIKGLYLFYFLNILPTIGKLLSPRGSAYNYLPNSVLPFPQRREFTERMNAAGFVASAWENLTFGTVCLYTGRVG